MTDDKQTDDLLLNILAIVAMYPGWITRRQIVQALDLPQYYFPHGVRSRICKLEQCGMIESQRCGKQWGGLWRYKATAKAWEG